MERGRGPLALLVMAVCLLTFTTGQFVEVTPHEAIVLPGKNISLLCKVSYPISFCRIKVPGTSNAYVLQDESNSDGIKYYGKGLKFGECGITLESVKEINNGKIVCSVSPSPGGVNEPSTNMSLIVAKPPQPPELLGRRPHGGAFQVNEELNIMCIVKEGRPPAKIVWYLDDQVLLDGVNQPTISELPISSLYTTSQNLTRRLRTSDHNRIIKCVAEHPALDRNYAMAQTQLNVQYGPQPLEDPIIVFGIKIGETAQINVTVEANPAPSLDWIFNGNGISAGSVDPTGRIDASIPIPLGNGKYNATLRIDSITREDTEREFTLNAANGVGSATYHIRISTLDEPQDGVGNNPKHRNIGETSDTESQVQSGEESRMTETTTAPKESPLSKVMAFPKSINLKAMLPGGNKNKDKVIKGEEVPPAVPAQLEEEKPLQTNGENPDQGLVYVELALQSNQNQQQGENIPATDRTEYAEIVYNKQPLENKLEKNDEKK